MTVTALAGRALNNQPFLITPGSQSSVPTAPGALTIAAGSITDTSFFVTWTQPTGSTPFHYQPKFRTAGSGSFGNFGTPVTGTSILFTGLTASTNYDFEVVVTNGTAPDVTSNVLTRQTSASSNGVAPPPLTDINFVQNSPISALSSLSPSLLYAGYVEPVGGIGPFDWKIIGLTHDGEVRDPNNYPEYSLQVSEVDGYGFGHDFKPVVRIDRYGAPITTSVDTITFQCTDGRGVVKTKTATIQKDNGTVDTIWVNGRLLFDNNQVYHYVSGPHVEISACGPSYGSGYNVAGPVFDYDTNATSTVWTGNGRWIEPINETLPTKTYHLRVTIVNAGNNATTPYDLTFTVAPRATVSYIELNQLIPISPASVPDPHIVIARAAATTSMNHPTWRLDDSSGTFGIGPATGLVTLVKAPTNTDPITFQITVTDELQSCTLPFTITPQPRTVLPSSNLTFSQNVVNNHTVGQTVGTAHVTGMSGTPVWTLVDYTDLNISLGYPAYGEGRILTMNSATGVVTQWNGLDVNGNYFISPYLAAKTYQVVVSVTDGVNVCNNTVSFVVDPPTVTTTYHIGAGMATAHPGFGFNHFVDFMVSQVGQGHHDDKIVVMIHANADPEYYTNDWYANGNNGYAIPAPGDYGPTYGYQEFTGPMRWEGVSLGDGTLARIGGPSNGQGEAGGHPRYGGHTFRLGCGDWEITNIEFSGFHTNSAWNTGHGPLFKNAAYGDLLIENCVFRDNDIAFTDVPTQQTTTIRYCEFTRCNSQLFLEGVGPAHNIYVEGGNAIIDHCVFKTNQYGHLVKCRARKSSITNCLIYDGLSTSGGHQVNYPNGGHHYLANNVIVKGLQISNNDMIRYGEDGASFADNNFLAENNTFIVLSPPGGQNYGPPNIFGCWNSLDPYNGKRGTYVIQNNQYYLPNPPSHQDPIYTDSSLSCIAGVIDAQTGTHVAVDSPLNPTLINNTQLTSVPTISFARPYLPGTMPIPGNVWLKAWGQEPVCPYPNCVRMGHIPDVHEIRVSHTAGTGTVLCNLRASSDGVFLFQGGTQQFDSTTTWAIDTTNTLYYGYLNPNVWAPASRYTITRNSDGTGTLKVGTGMPSTAGVDLIQVTATCGSNVSTDWYPIIVT